jgi:tmRNA-binding protein
LPLLICLEYQRLKVGYATRVRKLLLKRQEINKLIGNVERKGFTLVPTFMYWKNSRAKLEIGLAKGKKLHDNKIYFQLYVSRRHLQRYGLDSLAA